ncbi:hypothetical protein [Streptomyces sp. NPDC002402]
MSKRRDAVAVDPMTVGEEPVRVQLFTPRKGPGVRLQTAGRPYFGSAVERRDFADGRILFAMGLRPADRVGARRLGWFWADERAMEFAALEPHPIEGRVLPGDAIRYRPVPHGDAAPVPDMEPFGPVPAMPVEIRVGGLWHDARASWRVHDPAGDQIIVRIFFRDRGWPMAHDRCYWWDPAAIRACRPLVSD